MSPRRYALVSLGAVVAAGAIAAGIGLALGAGGGGGHELSPAEYRSRVSAICTRLGRELDRIPPPADIALYGEVASSVARALPVLRRLAAAIRAVPTPPQLRAGAERSSELRARSIVLLERALAAARRRDLGPMGQALVQFFDSRDRGKALDEALGLAC